MPEVIVKQILEVVALLPRTPMLQAGEPSDSNVPPERDVGDLPTTPPCPRAVRDRPRDTRAQTPRVSAWLLLSVRFMAATDYAELGEVKAQDGCLYTVTWSASEQKIYCGHHLIGEAPSAFEAKLKAEAWARTPKDTP